MYPGATPTENSFSLIISHGSIVMEGFSVLCRISKVFHNLVILEQKTLCGSMMA